MLTTVKSLKYMGTNFRVSKMMDMPVATYTHGLLAEKLSFLIFCWDLNFTDCLHTKYTKLMSNEQK